MGKIFIDGLEFYAFHGYFDEEQKIGGKYFVDVEIDTDFDHAAASDELDGTINYADIAKIVEAEMQIKSKLIEHVAGRIINRLFIEFGSIEAIKVKVEKINPPIGMKLNSVSVVLEKNREK
jgi:7,8-dihydroneopterin aldolase/epimerase/oxygenase